MGGCHAGSGRIMPEVVPPQRGRASFTATASSAFPKGNFRGNNIAALVPPKGIAIYIVLSHTSFHMTFKTPRVEKQGRYCCR